MSTQGCCGGGGREGAIGFGALDEGFGGGERGGGAGRRRSLGLHGEEHVLAGTASPYYMAVFARHDMCARASTARKKDTTYRTRGCSSSLAKHGGRAGLGITAVVGGSALSRRLWAWCSLGLGPKLRCSSRDRLDDVTSSGRHGTRRHWIKERARPIASSLQENKKKGKLREGQRRRGGRQGEE